MSKHLRNLIISVSLALSVLLGLAAPASANPGVWPLGVGSQGQGVRCVQTFLTTYAGQNIAVDGYYGPATKQAVVNLQHWGGLWPDGAVGKNTGDLIAYLWHYRDWPWFYWWWTNPDGPKCGNVVPTSATYHY
jgi:peptidoglycan hydrolase-like protein with peptidoglycan-binding domain